MGAGSRSGFASRSSTEWALYCADKAGFYAANGLRVLYVRNLQLYSRTGRFERGDFAQVIGVLVKTEQITPPAPSPQQLFDNRYVDAANAELRR